MTGRPPGLEVVEANGGPRERGRVHGEQVADVIHAVIARWHAEIAEDVGPDVERYLEGFLADTDFAAAAARWTPDLLAEVWGIAEGAGLSASTGLAWQLMDEEWWYRKRRVGELKADGERCSAAGGSRPGVGTVIGQNMDVEAFRDGSQVLLRSGGDGTAPDSLVVTTAGMIGLTGVNAKGLGVCCNALLELAPTTSGLPVSFVVRGLLCCHTLESARDFVHEVTHASGQNYLVGGPGGLFDVECSVTQVRTLEPVGDRVVHTNHVLTNGGPATRRPGSNTHERYSVLAERVLASDEAVTVGSLQEVLADRSAPVSVEAGAAGDFMTFASVVMELSDEPALHVAPGPPHHTDYSKFSFS